MLSSHSKEPTSIQPSPADAASQVVPKSITGKVIPALDGH
jgi:hypothetical protein